ncbi:MAG: hypothetical protein R3C97_12900 [Geminicoccaceae bacterium]
MAAGPVSFDQLVACIRGGPSPRVWSLLVTVFGELARAPDACIGGPLVNELCGLIGIKPAATRVALHRLRKDGWIDSRRTGKTSAHFLTEKGLASSIEASPRIYATGLPCEQALARRERAGRHRARATKEPSSSPRTCSSPAQSLTKATSSSPPSRPMPPCRTG